MSWIIEGSVVTGDMVADVMWKAIRVCSYWMDSWYVSRPVIGGDTNVAALSPQFFDGNFELVIRADDTRNTVNRDDVKRALTRLSEEWPAVFNNIQLMRADPDEADLFMQLCTFDTKAYFV